MASNVAENLALTPAAFRGYESKAKRASKFYRMNGLFYGNPQKKDYIGANYTYPPGNLHIPLIRHI